MKCHAGVEFQGGKPCPKCHATLGEVCWPGINADLLELARLRKEIEPLRSALQEAERFMAYFANETGGHFVGSGTPTTCLEQIRRAMALSLQHQPNGATD